MRFSARRGKTSKQFGARLIQEFRGLPLKNHASLRSLGGGSATFVGSGTAGNRPSPHLAVVSVPPASRSLGPHRPGEVEFGGYDPIAPTIHTLMRDGPDRQKMLPKVPTSEREGTYDRSIGIVNTAAKVSTRFAQNDPSLHVLMCSAYRVISVHLSESSQCLWTFQKYKFRLPL